MATAEPTSRLRVLVVDDNKDTADSLAALISRWGFSAKAAYDGPGALRCAEDLNPNIVLLDICLPGMNGWQLAAQLQASACAANAFYMAVSALGEDQHK